MCSTCSSKDADKFASEGAEAAKECTREGAEMCASQCADKCASQVASAPKECASEGADECASEGAEGMKECASKGAEGVCPRGRFLRRGHNMECTGEGALHAPVRTLTSAPARALMHQRSAPARALKCAPARVLTNAAVSALK